MIKHSQSELARQLRNAERRDPIDNAVLAMNALNEEDKFTAAARFNNQFDPDRPGFIMILRKVGG